MFSKAEFECNLFRSGPLKASWFCALLRYLPSLKGLWLAAKPTLPFWLAFVSVLVLPTLSPSLSLCQPSQFARLPQQRGFFAVSGSLFLSAESPGVSILLPLS